MHPTRDQIEHAAYDRWIRRHRGLMGTTGTTGSVPKMS